MKTEGPALWELIPAQDWASFWSLNGHAVLEGLPPEEGIQGRLQVPS